MTIAPLSAWQRRMLAVAVVLLVSCITAFLWVWIGQWSVPPGRYRNEGEWVREFAAPRAAWSLIIGLPLGAIAALVVLQVVGRRRRGVSVGGDDMPTE